MPTPLLPGAKLYFPNVVFRLVRSNLPPHQAVFRCPQQLNKLDIKGYLGNLYNLAITDVRTMNYLGSARRAKQVPMRTRKVATGAFKKVIVTMDSDFVFPEPPDVKNSNAMRLPPRVGFGHNAANRVRHLINEQALERGVDLQASQTSKLQ
ncbi:mitochondrial 54S ribosomal protein YmL41 [Polyrhizophydium stewartii]|uniref:Large ribosomal subunit protein uL23m n=1 Tax=Polyrhizophydium stewartii TaxID=2732419 RepID=A0ABR4NEL3_9FUNG